MTGGELPQVEGPAVAAGAAGEASAGPVFEVDGRPAPAPRAPPREALREVYEELLAIERERLAVAVRIERERGFVFPETSVIVRDVRTLAEKVYGPATVASTGAGAGASEGAAEPESSLVTPAAAGARRAPGGGGGRGAAAATFAGLDGLDDGDDVDDLLAELATEGEG